MHFSSLVEIVGQAFCPIVHSRGKESIDYTDVIEVSVDWSLECEVCEMKEE